MTININFQYYFLSDWNLLMMAGNEVWYQYLASLGDPDYSKFWDRIQTIPEKTVVTNVKEGINKTINELSVFHALETMLKKHFLENPPSKPIKLFGRGGSVNYAIIFTKNSPLKPIFQYGLRQVTFSDGPRYCYHFLMSKINTAKSNNIDLSQLFILGS